MKFEVGQQFTYRRTFTKEDVADFIKLSHYTGKHHEIPNEDGELLIQGLLTTMLPTKFGGEYNILMYKMVYNLIKPVYTGDDITCTVTVDRLFEKKGTNRIDMSFSTKNQREEEVLSGEIRGILLDL